MTTETALITVDGFESRYIADTFTGPLGKYFSDLMGYFLSEPAALSVNVDLSELAGFNSSWVTAVEAAKVRYAAELEAMAEESYEMEQAEIRRNPELAGRL